MKVSVIVPTYRRADFLMTVLNSLAAQTFKDFEIILVDDNDDSEWNEKVQAVAEQFKKNNPDIVVEHIENHPNKGSAGARNAGIAVAKGEYVTFLDDDDVYLPEKIQHQLEAMEQEQADYSITDLLLYNDDEKLIDNRTRTYISDTDKKSLVNYHLMYHMTGTDTMMFRKDYIDRIGGFPPIDVGDEFYLMCNAIEAEGKFLYVPGCYVKAYVHNGEDGLSSGQSKIQGEIGIHQYKKGYFTGLNKKTIRFINTRHRAVLAFAYLRMKKYVRFLLQGVLAVLISPRDAIQIIRDRK